MSLCVRSTTVGAPSLLSPPVHHGTGTYLLVQVSFPRPLYYAFTFSDVRFPYGHATVTGITLASPTSYIVEVHPLVNETIGMQIVDSSTYPEFSPSNVTKMYYEPAGTHPESK